MYMYIHVHHNDEITKNEIKFNTIQINTNQNAAIGSNRIVWNVIQNSIILTNYITM